jgi:hypothetical protein
MTPGQDETLNDLQYAIRKDLSLDQALWELQRSRERLIAAIQASTPRGLDASLYGEASLGTRHEEEHAGWIKRWRGEKGY